MTGKIVAVASASSHKFSKQIRQKITLLAGLGVEGDAHAGITVQHRSRVAKDPSQPNLRQVHLMQAELFDEVAGTGYSLKPGEMGENITTRSIDLLALAEGTLLRLGPGAVVQVTGLRNPCSQIDKFQKGLLGEMIEKQLDGVLIRKAGVMAIVLHGGVVAPGDGIVVEPPVGERRALVCV